MCIGGSSSPPPPPPPVAPPPPPPQITINPAPMLAPPRPPEERRQTRPDSPVKRRRQGVRRRGKSMLKIPLNTSRSSGVNI